MQLFQQVKELLEQVSIFNAVSSINFEKYYLNKPKFNGVYSRDNLLKLKDGDM